jgi:hypothetical protein
MTSPLTLPNVVVRLVLDAVVEGLDDVFLECGCAVVSIRGGIDMQSFDIVRRIGD